MTATAVNGGIYNREPSFRPVDMKRSITVRKNEEGAGAKRSVLGSLLVQMVPKPPLFIFVTEASSCLGYFELILSIQGGVVKATPLGRGGGGRGGWAFKPPGVPLPSGFHPGILSCPLSLVLLVTKETQLFLTS